MKKILVLTPDGVGSTFLQRSLCIFGNLSGEKWFNVHEITNGITHKNNHLIKDWNLRYSQDLSEIQAILETNHDNLIGRLAHYHIILRKDNIEKLKNFYSFLNSEFEIISCARSNIFEYAHSWAIREYKKTLNVYNFAEKNKIHPENDSFILDSDFFANKINDYFNYMYWVNDNFQTSCEFDYDNLKDIDKFICDILNLQNNPFEKRFGITLYEYCHLSNMNSIMHLPKKICKTFFKIRLYAYNLVNDDMMPNSLPLKMNSFEKKIKKTSNFEELTKVYNNQTKKYNRLQYYDIDELKQIAVNEQFSTCNQNIMIQSLINKLS